jgi:PAS domain S-box-containing protein
MNLLVLEWAFIVSRAIGGMLMAREPTSEELVQRINELENQAKARKKVEEALLREKDFSESVIDSLPGIFYVFDEKGRFLRWNEHFEKMTELSSEELSNACALELVAEEDKEAATDAIQKVFVKGKSYVEANFVSKSGKKTPYYLAGLRTRIDDCTYLVGMGIDNTVRKKAEEALREYKQAVEASEELVVVVDKDYKYRLVNGAFLRRHRMRRDQVVAHTVENVFGKEIFQNMVKPNIERCFNGEDVHYEIAFAFPDLGQRILEVHYSPLKSSAGDITCVVGVTRDITERKRAEEVLRKDHDELELRVQQRTAELVRANELLQFEMEERKRLEKALMHKEKLKTLGAIAAEVAHEIRNPLVSIGGFAQRLKQKFADLPECDIILSESQRLEKILFRIRDYLEPVEVHPQECCINTIITDCVELLSPETERRRVMCQLALDSRLSPGYVDPEILAEIFINLIRNAAEAIEKEGILMVKSFETDKELHIEFKNKTTSLEVKDPEALFMPFAEGGDSFGLPLCYRLLKDMGGLLSFKNENDFMIFTVSLRKTVQPDPDDSEGQKRSPNEI